MNRFENWYGPSHVQYGPGSIRELPQHLERCNVSNVMLVTSSSVADLSAVMDPVEDALDDYLVDIFSDVSIQKSADTVDQALDRVVRHDIDGLVSLGGGSTVDIARAISAVYDFDGDPRTLFARVRDDELVTPSIRGECPPVFAVPTTLSGAEVTCATGMNFDSTNEQREESREGPIIDERLWPAAIVYDPELAVPTPDSVIVSSGMNGLDHAIEMLYSRNGTPFTDATAKHGLGILAEAYPATVEDPTDTAARGNAMVGVALGATGLIDPVSGPKYSLIHAFGHRFAQRYTVQQGYAHGAVAPSVLAYIFEHVDGKRDALAEALGCQPDDTAPEATAEAVVSSVRDIRDRVGIPSGLRDIEGVEREHFPELAAAITDDIGVRFGPPGLSPTPGQIEGVLQDAW
jgi:alcohol dehydrogenase class IV